MDHARISEHCGIVREDTIDRLSGFTAIISGLGVICVGFSFSCFEHK